MIVNSHKTHKIHVGDDIEKILDDYLPRIEEKSIVVITSKIISLCQKDVVNNDGTVDKKELIKQEADWYYIDKKLEAFGTVIPTIKNDILIANAGIDESNVEDIFVLWPKNCDQTAIDIWTYLRKKRALKELGILITDSCLPPLRYGTHGIGIAWCGFEALTDYRGKPDIFGRNLRMTLKNNMDGFAAAAVEIMGEGDEQTPLAIIKDIPFTNFQNRPPTGEEQQNMRISKEYDIFGKMLTSVEWEKGGKA